MKIYLDYVFFINFIFDFILLFTTKILLKRNVKIKRIILGSFIGTFSIFILFISMPSFIFFLSKMFFGLIMVIITFKFKDIKYTLNNFFYLMILSIILGGFLYFLNIEAGYEHVGLIFYKTGKTLDIFILLLLSILFFIIFTKKIKKYKNKISCYKTVKIFLNNKTYLLNGYIDTGNNLVDPYFNKPILIINKNIDIFSKRFIFVPYNSLNNKGILKCFIIDKVFIEDIGYLKNVLIAKSNDKLSLSGVDIILNNKIMEELWKKYFYLLEIYLKKVVFIM